MNTVPRYKLIYPVFKTEKGLELQPWATCTEPSELSKTIKEVEEKSGFSFWGVDPITDKVDERLEKSWNAQWKHFVLSQGPMKFDQY